MKKLIKWDKYVLPELKKTLGAVQSQLEEDDEDEDEIEDEERPVKGQISIPISAFMQFAPLLSERPLYIADTNFVLTKQDEEVFENTNGIECWKIISKYSFIIGIGKMFDPVAVVDELESNLGITSVGDIEVSEENSELITNKILEATKKGEHWAMYVFPNGSTFTEHFETDEELQNNKEKFDVFKDFSEGEIIFSDEN